MRQKMKAYMRLIVLLFASLLGVSSVYGSVPERINYQGYLTDKSGNPVTTPVSVTVSIYTVPVGGTPFWTETHNVVPDNGVYNIVLGSMDPLYLDHSVYDLFYLGVKVGSDAEMTPRQEVTSVGSAHTAWTALNLVCTNCVSASEVDTTSIQRRVTGTCTAGSSIRMIDQNGTVTCETDDGITAETDPQVGAVTAGKWCAGDGSAVQCSQNPPVLSESDPQVGTLSANLWCASNAGATAIDCNQPAPAVSTHNHDTTYWKLTGNSGTTGSNFIGTTDNQNFEVRVNNSRAMIILPNAVSPTIMGGYFGNVVMTGVAGATISGGGSSGAINYVSDNYSTIGGGSFNYAGTYLNSDPTDATHCTIGGGHSNEAKGYASTISGGDVNTTSGDYSTVGGGQNNTASGDYSTVGGGESNAASGYSSTVGGGAVNTASGYSSTVGGGESNAASGDYSTVGGGAVNLAQGDYSFAAGLRATAYNKGCFVWGDSTSGDTICNVNDAFVASAKGGFYFITSKSDPFWMCTLHTGDTGWVCPSDRNLKENIIPSEGGEILRRLVQIPVSYWNAKGGDAANRHLGPMAQDFYAAFGLGTDDTHINTGDLDGVALASIQGLYQLLQEKDTKIKEQDTRIEKLEKLIAEMEKRIAFMKDPIKPLAKW